MDSPSPDICALSPAAKVDVYEVFEDLRASTIKTSSILGYIQNWHAEVDAEEVRQNVIVVI